MIKVGELDLLPVPGWKAPPTYFISSGGLGYQTLSWLMYYIKQYLPEGIGMHDFSGAQFMAVDTDAADTDVDDLPPQDWAKTRLFRMPGDLNQIIDDVIERGLFPGINDFYEDTEIARKARHQVGDLKDGAGTTRPFGRIGFFYNWERFYEALINLLNKSIDNQEMKYGGTFEVTKESNRHFFIVSSLAGGTGSSCFLDIAAGLRYLRNKKYAHESWSIVGIFTLAEVLSSDMKIHKELHRTRMKANAYAALKELNHYMEGNPFNAQYGRNGSFTVRISNRREQDKLFDLAFLVDTPNQDNQPLSGRKEVAQFLAQSMLLIGLTGLNFDFFSRLVDSTAQLMFMQEYPPWHLGTNREERQLHLFSSIGLSTLSLPLTKYLDYSFHRLSHELLVHLNPDESALGDEMIAEQFAVNTGLTVRHLDQVFDQCQPIVIDDFEECMTALREAGNPMEELRRLASGLEGIPGEQIRKEAQRILDKEFQTFFPSAGKGLISQELDKLLDKRMSSHACVALKKMVDDLKYFQDRLHRELEDAQSQLRAGEAPGFLNPSDGKTSTYQHEIFADVLDDMEQSWSALRSRIFGRFFRNRFFQQFESAIEDTIALLQRFQKNAYIILVWQTKIVLVKKIIAELTRIRNDIDAKTTHYQQIESEILSRRDQIVRSLAPVSRFQLPAIEASQYFEKIFLKRLGALSAYLNEWSKDIQENGLFLSPSARVKFSDWVNYPVETIVKAIYEYCREKSIGSYPDSKDELSGVDSQFQVGLNDPLFMPGDKPSFFDKTLMEWKTKSHASLRFTGITPEASRYVISGCRMGDDPTSWIRTLNLHGLTHLPGRASNQASLLTIAMGFPLQHFARIKDWFEKSYVPQRRDRWPLHLFKEDVLDVMVEPYLDWLRMPSSSEAEQLWQEALRWQIVSRVISVNSSGEKEKTIYIDEETIENMPKRIKSFFFESKPKPKIFSLKAIQDYFQQNKGFTAILKHALLNCPVSKDSNPFQWQKHPEIVLKNGTTITQILNWSKQASLIKEENEQLYFDERLFHQTEGRQDDFCEIFFDRKSLIPKKITESEFISALSTHKPVCRWVTKKVIRMLIHPSQWQESMRRLAENELEGFLEDILRLYLNPRG